MTLAWPIPLDEFFEGLPIQQVMFRLMDNRLISTTRGVEVIPHQVGPRLWEGEVTLDIDTTVAMGRIEARMALLEQAGASLLIYDRRKRAPASDPSGAVAGSTVQIDTLSPDMREISLKGLPGGYVITQGDYLAFGYGSNPVRRALHRVVTGATADGSGLSPAFEVTPPIRPGAAADAAVSLVQPSCKAIIVTADYGMGRSVFSSGAVFRWQQTLR